MAENRAKKRDSMFETEIDDQLDPESPHLRLLDLPADVLLLLSDHLDIASKASLRLTCRALNLSIPTPDKPLQDDLCARTAIYRHVDERRDAADGKHRCALCKALYTDSQFRRARIIDPEFPFTNFASPKLSEPSQESRILSVEQPESQAGSEKLIPSTRICAWHVNRFVFPPSAALYPDPTFDRLVSTAAEWKSCTPSLAAKVAESGWASSTEPICMHCGRLVVCVCSVGNCDTCACDCTSCGVRRVRCWWKLAKVGSGPTRDASFKMARSKWLIARAEEMDRFGWDGLVLNAGGMVDWGLVRVVRCARAAQAMLRQSSGKRVVREPSTYLKW